MLNYAEAVKRNDFVYVLRRTIPPWKWRAALDEAVDMCEKYRIDELCVFIDSGTFTHYFPDEKWLRNYQHILFEVKQRLEDNGIIYSLNPNVTQGHGDRGRHIGQQHPDWHMITDAAGVRAEDCACSISEGWRDYIRGQWTLYAETHPTVIWIEDDIRLSGHGPVGFGCFCEGHIRGFNARYGTSYSRAEIAAKIFAPGTPDPLREKWLSFTRETTASTIRLLSETIHAVSPETVIGLMSSGPEYHAVEGRDWKELHTLMAGSRQISVASRPPLGNYEEQSLNGLLYTANQIQLTRRVFDGKRCIEEGEIENFPYTNYSKSNAFLALQNDVAMSSGCNALTLNLFDHSGTPMAVHEDILCTLGKHKKYLAALKSRYPENGTSAGIGVFFSPDSARHKKLEAGGHGLECNVTHFPGLLQNMGIAVSFQKDAGVMLLIGECIAAASDDEILRYLSGAAFIDASAFQILSERGFGQLLGAEIQESFRLNTTYAIGGEHLFNRDFGGSEDCFFDTAIHTAKPLVLHLKPERSAVSISRLIDIDLNVLFPCCYYYTNSRGGKIVVYPLEVSKLSAGFRTPRRKEMLYQLFRHLTGGAELPLYLTGGRPSLPLRTDGPKNTLISLYDLSLDPLSGTEARLSLKNKPRSVEYLNDEGDWIRFDNDAWSNGVLVLKLDSFDRSRPRHFNLVFC